MMVGQAHVYNKSITDYFGSKTTEKLGVRQLILLALGPINHPIVLNQAYLMVKNLTDRIPSSFHFNLPSKKIFQSMISKLTKLGVIDQIKLADKNQYAITLSEFGYGEFDWVKYNISDTKYEIAWIDYIRYHNLDY